MGSQVRINSESACLDSVLRPKYRPSVPWFLLKVHRKQPEPYEPWSGSREWEEEEECKVPEAPHVGRRSWMRKDLDEWLQGWRTLDDDEVGDIRVKAGPGTGHAGFRSAAALGNSMLISFRGPLPTIHLDPIHIHIRHGKSLPYVHPIQCPLTMSCWNTGSRHHVRCHAHRYHRTAISTRRIDLRPFRSQSLVSGRIEVGAFPSDRKVREGCRCKKVGGGGH